MLDINKSQENGTLTVTLAGRLDTVTAPELESSLKESLADTAELILDCEKLEYISSAGLRVLLAAQKIMNRQGGMKLRRVNESVMEILEVTGFTDILTVE